MTSYSSVCDIAVANLNHKNCIVFSRALVLPHFENSSATHA